MHKNKTFNEQKKVEKRGRILPRVNESLREESIYIVTVLDSDVLDRLAKDL